MLVPQDTALYQNSRALPIQEHLKPVTLTPNMLQA